MCKRLKISLWLPVGLCLAILGLGCGSSAERQGKADYENDIDSAEIKLTFADTLKVQAGEIPPDWKKQNLGKGYYVGFPQSPRREDKKGLTAYKIKQRDYMLWLSVRDMSKEASFSQFKADKTAYYYAISNELNDGLSLPDSKMETVYKKSYTALQLYEGLETYMKASDNEIYARWLVIDNRLFSFAFISWIKPTGGLLQLKDRFFATFGKELEID